MEAGEQDAGCRRKKPCDFARSQQIVHRKSAIDSGSHERYAFFKKVSIKPGDIPQ